MPIRPDPDPHQIQIFTDKLQPLLYVDNTQRFREFQTFILDGNQHKEKPQKRAEKVGPTGK